MGGYGSGGLNKTHDRVENYRFRKIDSFAFYEFLRGDKYLHYKTEVKYPIVGNGIIYHVKSKTAGFDCDGHESPLGLSRVPNIDGITMRMYFLCPECGKRVRYLYRKDVGYLCRKCAGLNYESQQKSGSEELIRKMRYIVEKKLEYTYWEKEYPDLFIMDLMCMPKPRYMRWAKYNRLMQELRELQLEYLKKELHSLDMLRRRVKK